MHERYCLNHISKCIKCNEPILNDDMEDHVENCGVSVVCEFCSMTLSKSELQSHISLCLKKPKNCEFCTVQLDYDDTNHEINCGSRTEICPYCDETILVKHYEDHLNISCTKEKKIDECISIEKYIALQKKNKIIPYQNQRGSISILNDLGLLYNSKKPEASTEIKSEVKQSTMKQISMNQNKDSLQIIPKGNDPILQKKLEKLKKKGQNDEEKKNCSRKSKIKANLTSNKFNFDDFQFITKYESSSLGSISNKISPSKKENIQSNETISKNSNRNGSSLIKGIMTSKYSDYYFD